MIVFTDIHGNFDTFLALYDKIPQEAKDKGVAIAGDLVDRGPKSREMIQWCIDHPEVKVVKGNHEEMMLDNALEQAEYFTKHHRFHFGRLSTPNIFMINGGDATMNSYVDDHGDGSATLNMSVLKEHLEWIDSLPYYLEFKDVKNDKGEHLLVTHSSAASVWKWSEKRREENKKQFIANITWGRPNQIHAIPNIYNIFGHTPEPNGPKIKSCYANIDTGCFFNGMPGFFKLTAIEFPSMQVWQQDNIDMKKEEDDDS